MSILRRYRGGLRPRQMRHAILFAVAGDPEIEIGIAQLGRAANCAFVERLGFAARFDFKPLAPRRDFVTMARVMNDLRSEKDKVIA